MTQLVVYEGLSPILIGTPAYVQRGLLDRVKLKDVSLWRGSFVSKGPSPLKGADRVIVVGHSMGGASAIWWCNQYPGLKIDLLLTLDPRPLHRPYIKPKNVDAAVNFYQRGWWLPGYQVENAGNVLVGVRHTSIPALDEVKNLLEDAINGRF